MVMITALYVQLGRVIDQTNKEVNNIEIKRAYNLTNKIILHIKSELNGDISSILSSPKSREKLNSFLSLNVTDEFKYIYVISRDKKGVYRYLLDGSYGADRGEYRQKFFPLLKELWQSSFNSRLPVFGFQKKADGLWLTYLHSIRIGGRVVAVLALDISTSEYQTLKRLLVPLREFLKIFLFVLLVSIIVILMQIYMFYKERKKSIIDPLTRLYNRNYLKEIWNRINLKKTAILMLDIDHFKSVNDKYGHDVGDVVLSSVAKRLMRDTRLEDRIIRYGGEEFLILVKWPKSDDEVLQIANRICKNMAKEKIRINEDMNLHITISIGVNLNPQRDGSLKNAIKKADKMLYIAKNRGRNRVEAT